MSLNWNLTGSSLVLVAVCKKLKKNPLFVFSCGVKMNWWDLKPLCFFHHQQSFVNHELNRLKQTA